MNDEKQSGVLTEILSSWWAKPNFQYVTLVFGQMVFRVMCRASGSRTLPPRQEMQK